MGLFAAIAMRVWSKKHEGALRADSVAANAWFGDFVAEMTKCTPWHRPKTGTAYWRLPSR
jgi:hypothetical protein